MFGASSLSRISNDFNSRQSLANSTSHISLKHSQILPTHPNHEDQAPWLAQQVEPTKNGASSAQESQETINNFYQQ